MATDIYRLFKKNPKAIIDGLWKRSIENIDLPNNDSILSGSLLREITTTRRASDARLVYRLLRVIAKYKLKLFYEKDYAETISKLKLFSKNYIRDIESFKQPKTKASRKQLNALINHLLVKYDTPKFLYSCFFDNRNEHINWFIHIAQGGNVRGLKGIPVKLSKKQAHLFMKTDERYTIMEAFRIAQIKDIGGDERLCDYLFEAGFGNNFENDIFWKTFFKFLVDNPMFDYRKIQEVKDYVNYLKFGTTMVGGENGVIKYERIKPNFTFKNRNPQTLLDETERWHTVKTKRKGHFLKAWHGFEVEGFYSKTKKKLKHGGDNFIEHFIHQILSSEELKEEGRALGHCVGSYSQSCANGKTSIWSLQIRSTLNPGIKRLVSIEVGTSMEVSQIRGKGNRYPTKEELKIIEKWAAKVNLKISRYVKTN